VRTFDEELVTIAGEEFGALDRNCWNGTDGSQACKQARENSRTHGEYLA